MKAPQRSMKLEAIWGRAFHSEEGPGLSDEVCLVCLGPSKQGRLVLEQGGQQREAAGRSEEPQLGYAQLLGC